VLPRVHVDDLFLLWKATCDADFPTANVHLLTDMIACPAGDFCALTNRVHEVSAVPAAADGPDANAFDAMVSMTFESSEQKPKCEKTVSDEHG
jgi:hypothetical protein